MFPRVRNDRSIWAEGVKKLAEIPLDPALAHMGDAGRPALTANGSGTHAEAFRRVAERVIAELDMLRSR